MRIKWIIIIVTLIKNKMISYCFWYYIFECLFGMLLNAFWTNDAGSMRILWWLARFTNSFKSFFCLFIVIQQLHRSISMSPIFPNSNLTVNHLYLLILSSSALFYHSTYGCFWPHLPHFDICDHLWILIN